MVGTGVFVAAVSGAAGAFVGITKAHSDFQRRLNHRFEKLEGDLNNLKSTVIHDYVLKEDFLREMQGVHNKLDRILDYLIRTSSG
jgi:hypothetical protein